MTTAEIRFDGETINVEIENHADSKIVCAACSILACTLINCLTEERERGRLYALSVNVNSGSVFVFGGVSNPNDERIKAILHTVFVGYKSLEEKYPDNVKVVG